ncbi:MAG TPA: VWA domain-containing protein [Dehalococcoidia bacterium]|nr:VWA domain-containing protein [Dehalococcoidia bacterium]
MPGDLLAHLVRFARALRQEGVPVTPDQVTALARALEVLPSLDQETFRLAARATLLCRQEDMETFERLFRQVFGQGQQRPATEAGAGAWSPRPRRPLAAQAPLVPRGPDEEEGSPLAGRTFSYSPEEVLRRRRFDECTPEELALLASLVRGLRWSLPPRRSRRLRPARRTGRPDLRRTLRRSLRYGGEQLLLAWREPSRRPRRLVVLADISGSMERYTRMLLLFLHALGRSGQAMEVFLFGSRLTRVTALMRRRDPDAALAEMGRTVPDWSGGTRIGQCLHSFNRYWGKRVLGRGAVVVIISDGWDQGEPELLAAEMERLQKRCHRLLWLNPLLGLPGYQPLTRGMQAALPYVDEFLPAGNLASLESLARHLRELPATRAPRRAGAPPPRP